MATCDSYSHTVKRHFFRPCYKAQILPSSKLGDYVGTMHLPVHLVFVRTTIGFLTSVEILFSTLAPRACITYYQARGLSGHTSPCGECVCFLTPTPLMFKDATLQDHLHFFSKIQVGTLPRTEIFFFLLKSTIHSSDNLFLRRQRWSKDVKDSGITCQRRSKWHVAA